MKTRYIVYAALAILLISMVIYRLNQNKGANATPAGAGGAGKGAAAPTNVNGVIIVAESFASSLSVSGSI